MLQTSYTYSMNQWRTQPKIFQISSNKPSKARHSMGKDRHSMGKDLNAQNYTRFISPLLFLRYWRGQFHLNMSQSESVFLCIWIAKKCEAKTVSFYTLQNWLIFRINRRVFKNSIIRTYVNPMDEDGEEEEEVKKTSFDARHALDCNNFCVFDMGLWFLVFTLLVLFFILFYASCVSSLFWFLCLPPFLYNSRYTKL